MSAATYYRSATEAFENPDTLPVKSAEITRKTDFSTQAALEIDKEIVVELEYAQTIFPVDGSTVLLANAPLRLIYHEGDETLEIAGWGLRIDLSDGAQLPRLISRHFLKLYGKSITDRLNEEERRFFGEICNQVDYRDFTRSRELPRYREARLIHKHPCLLQFLSLKNTKLDSSLLPSFHLLEEGDYFGALFTVDKNGTIIDVRNITILPEPTGQPKDVAHSEGRPLEFPESLKGYLPNPETWEPD